MGERINIEGYNTCLESFSHIEYICHYEKEVKLLTQDYDGLMNVISLALNPVETCIFLTIYGRQNSGRLTFIQSLKKVFGVFMVDGSYTLEHNNKLIDDGARIVIFPNLRYESINYDISRALPAIYIEISDNKNENWTSIYFDKIFVKKPNLEKHDEYFKIENKEYSLDAVFSDLIDRRFPRGIPIKRMYR